MSSKKKLSKKFIIIGSLIVLIVIVVAALSLIEADDKDFNVKIKNDSKSVYNNYSGDTIKVDKDVKKQVESKIVEKREESARGQKTNIEHIPIDAEYIEIGDDINIKDLFKDEFIPCVTSEYDENGFNCKTGFNREGFNVDGLDRNGFDKDGCNSLGLDILGNSCGEPVEVEECIDGVDSDGNLCGIYANKYDENGCDENGLDVNGVICYVEEEVEVDEPIVEAVKEKVIKKIEPICLTEEECLENKRYNVSLSDEERVWYEKTLKNKMNKAREMIDNPIALSYRIKNQSSFSSYVEEEVVEDIEETKNPENGNNGQNQVVNNEIQIPVGSMINARLRADLNSDYAGIVRASVVGGPLHGADLFGEFTVPFIGSDYMPRDKVSITFSSMVYKRENYAIQAVGLDGASMTDYISGNVNNHYVKRWGGLIASSLVKGIGDSVKMGRESSVSDNNNVVKSAPIEKTSEQLKVGFGEVASELADIARGQFNRPPTVTISKNSSSGSLFPVVFLTEVVDENIPMLFSRSEQAEINKSMMNNYTN